MEYGFSCGELGLFSWLLCLSKPVGPSGIGQQVIHISLPAWSDLCYGAAETLLPCLSSHWH